MNRLYGTSVSKRTVLLWVRRSGYRRTQSEAAKLSSRLMRHIRALGIANAIALKMGYTRPTEDLAYIVGVVMGDGYLDKYDIRLETVDREFAEAFSRCLASQFGRRGSVSRGGGRLITSPLNGKTYRNRRTFRFTLVSGAASSFLRRLKKAAWILSLTRRAKLAWLRGIWDSEGWISRRALARSHQWTVGFGVMDAEVARLYSKVLLSTTKIRPKQRKDLTRNMRVFVFSRLEEVVGFYRLVNPTIRRKCREFLRASRYFETHGALHAHFARLTG